MEQFDNNLHDSLQKGDNHGSAPVRRRRSGNQFLPSENHEGMIHNESDSVNIVNELSENPPAEQSAARRRRPAASQSQSLPPVTEPPSIQNECPVVHDIQQSSKREQAKKTPDVSSSPKKKKTWIIIVAVIFVLGIAAGFALPQILSQKSTGNVLPKNANTETTRQSVRLTKENAAIGGIVSFGHYPQKTDGTDNTPIEWMIEAIDGNKVLLVSRYALDAQPYTDKENSYALWKDCLLRNWLNTTFQETAFTAEEQKGIVTTLLKNDYAEEGEEENTRSENDTEDKVFVLSYQEMQNYFVTDESRMCIATNYAHKKNGYVGSQGTSQYYLRAMGEWYSNISLVDTDGSMMRSARGLYPGSVVPVRPALWVDFDAVEVKVEPSNHELIGKTLTFGNYPQKDLGEDNTEIEWIVLDADEEKLLLLSVHGLDYLPYNASEANVSWKNSSLRYWLNHDFLNQAFSDETKEIVTTAIDDGETSEIAYDKIFLLSSQEVNECSFIIHELYNPSEYAVQKTPGEYEAPGTNLRRKKVLYEDSSLKNWWLRSHELSSDEIDMVTVSGNKSQSTATESLIVRPAMWISYGGISESDQNKSIISTVDLSQTENTAQSDYEYELNNNEITVTAYKGNKQFINIPDSMDGYPVTRIGANAFQNSAVLSVAIPASVTVVDGGAFSGCTFLKRVSAQNQNIQMDQSAFTGCSELGQVIIAGIDQVFTDSSFPSYPSAWHCESKNVTIIIDEKRAYYTQDDSQGIYYIVNLNIKDGQLTLGMTDITHFYIKLAAFGNKLVNPSTGDVYESCEMPEIYSQYIDTADIEFSDLQGTWYQSETGETLSMEYNRDEGLSMTFGESFWTIKEITICGHYLYSFGVRIRYDSPDTIFVSGTKGQDWVQYLSKEKFSEGKQEQVQSLIEQGDFDAAIEEQKNPVLGDTTDQITETQYQKGLSLYENKDYEAAFNVFYEIKDYPAAAHMLANDENMQQARADIESHAKQQYTALYNLDESIEFGHYEQDNKLENGPEAIEWLIISRDNNQAFLVSRYALDLKSFDSSCHVYWSNTDLCTWLLNDFLTAAFSSQEQEALIGEEKVSLLTGGQYYGLDAEDKTTTMTPYANADGKYREYYFDGYDIVSVEYKGGNVWYWLQEGSSWGGVTVAGSTSEVSMGSLGPVRPCIMLDIEKGAFNTPYLKDEKDRLISECVLKEKEKFSYTEIDADTIEITGYTGDTFTGDFIIPETIHGKTVVSIGSNAFEGRTDFVGNLILPNTLTYIGTEAFYGCSGLTGDLNIPEGVITIASSAFGKCGFNGNLNLPESLESIEAFAFYGCNFTGPLMIPGQITVISDGAFGQCNFTGELCIPGTVTEIGERAFELCYGFTGNLVIPGSVSKIGEKAFEGCHFTGTLTVSKGVEYIGGHAFADNKLSGSIAFPDTLFALGDYAFEHCQNLESVSFSSNTTIIGDSAFYRTSDSFVIYGAKDSFEQEYANQHNIPFVCLEETITYDSKTDNVFAGTEESNEASLESIDYISELSQLVSDPDAQTYQLGAYTYILNQQNEAIITKYTPEAYCEEIVIPSELDGYPVVAIGDNAFAYSEQVFSVTIPGNIVCIGSSAFAVCRSIEIVNLSEGLQCIGDYAFESCAITEITIPDSLCYMGNNPFRACGKLTTFEISSAHPCFTVIENALFDIGYRMLICYPGGLTDEGYSIPQGTKIIGGCAFERNNTLTYITIPEGVETIGFLAFGSCENIEVLQLPKSLRTIQDSAFSRCSHLHTLNIYEGVTYIGKEYISDCTDLWNIYIPESVIFLGDPLFDDAYSNWYSPVFYVKKGSYAEQYMKDHNIYFQYYEKDNEN